MSLQRLNVKSLRAAIDYLQWDDIYNYHKDIKEYNKNHRKYMCAMQRSRVNIYKNSNNIINPNIVKINHIKSIYEDLENYINNTSYDENYKYTIAVSMHKPTIKQMTNFILLKSTDGYPKTLGGIHKIGCFMDSYQCDAEYINYIVSDGSRINPIPMLQCTNTLNKSNLKDYKFFTIPPIRFLVDAYTIISDINDVYQILANISFIGKTIEEYTAQHEIYKFKNSMNKLSISVNN